MQKIHINKPERYSFLFWRLHFHLPGFWWASSPTTITIVFESFRFLPLVDTLHYVSEDEPTTTIFFPLFIFYIGIESSLAEGKEPTGICFKILYFTNSPQRNVTGDLLQCSVLVYLFHNLVRPMDIWF